MKVKDVVSKDNNDNEVKLTVKKPTAKQLLDARTYSVETFTKALNSNAKTREQMHDYMKDNNIFGEKEEKKIEEISKKLRDGARQLARGGKTETGDDFSLEQGRKLALDMREWRTEQLLLSFKQRELDEFTLQGISENAEFNYLVANCTFNEEGNFIFETVDDYMNKRDEPYAIEAARGLAEITNQVDSDYEKKLPENKFLIKYGFVREKDLRLINEDGHLIDKDGRLVNEDGRFINSNNELVDKDGNLVDEDGNPVEEFVDFVK